MSKRNGFTLIEIMVVVVIMGVLAAVGVPKLFGVIAKAKAAEVPVAAGTYISLQNTYLHENNAVGSWQNIGYGAPDGGKSDNFEYIGCIQGKIALKAGGERMVGWQAFNLSSLNSCTPRSSWSIIINPLGEHELNYEHIVSSAECGALTLNWTVGAAGEGACAATTAMKPESSAEEEPESSDDNEESSSASEPEPGSSASSQSSASNQSSSSAIDCEALMATGHADDPRNIKGGHCGWCYVQECRLAVNKGQSGLSVDECVRLCDYEKDHDVNKEIEDYEEEQRRKEQEQQQSSNSGGSGTGGGTGGTNSGGGTNQGTSAGGSSAQPTSAVTPDEESSSSEGRSSSEESSSSAVPVIKAQNGNTLNYESIPATVCTKTNGNCNNKDYIPKEQCAVYNTSTKRCTTVASSSSSN